MAEYGVVPVELQEKIFAMNNLDELSRLLKLAAKVSSIEEFEENMQ